jgi:hypothetical protein
MRLAARERPLAASADARPEIGRVGGAIAVSAARGERETDACRALFYNLYFSELDLTVSFITDPVRSCGRRKKRTRFLVQSLP